MNGVIIEKLDAFTDARGWSVHPVDYGRLSNGGIDNIHVVSMAPGAVRGNHFHKEQTEDVFIFGGPCRLVLRDTATGAVEELTIDEGRLTRIRLSPGIAHAFQNTGEGISYLVCSSERRFSPESPDTFREALIP